MLQLGTLVTELFFKSLPRIYSKLKTKKFVSEVTSWYPSRTNSIDIPKPEIMKRVPVNKLSG